MDTEGMHHRLGRHCLHKQYLGLSNSTLLVLPSSSHRPSNPSNNNPLLQDPPLLLLPTPLLHPKHPVLRALKTAVRIPYTPLLHQWKPSSVL